MEKKQIWVYAELSGDKVADVYYELLGKARALADEMGGTSVAAVVLGQHVDDAVSSLKTSGADAVYVVDHDRLRDYNVQGYACAIAELIRKYDPYMVLMGVTAAGAELAPTVAAKVKTGLAAHAVDICIDGDRVNFMIPAFGGKLVSEIYIPEARPMMGSIRPGILDTVAVAAVDDCEVISEDGAFLSDVPVYEELVEFIPSPPAGKDVSASEIVVAAGRGVNDAAWEHLQQFADRIGGAVGWSRSFVDVGMVPDESQLIGTSSKSIRAKLYIGFGISGASHFTCGIGKSKTVISINKDENAPIFGVSDYGVACDADKILTGLLAKF